MQMIQDITIDRTPSVKPLYAPIDLREHSEFIPLLKEKEIEIAESPYNQEFVAKIRRAEKQPSVKVDIDNLWK